MLLNIFKGFFQLEEEPLSWERKDIIYSTYIPLILHVNGQLNIIQKSRKQADKELVSLFGNCLRYLYYFEIPNNETYMESLPTLYTLIPFSTHFGNEVHGQFYLESRTFKSVIMDCHGSYIWKRVYPTNYTYHNSILFMFCIFKTSAGIWVHLQNRKNLHFE